MRKWTLWLAVVALLPSLAWAGDDTVKLCRGGTNHGKVCASDSDCPTDSGGATATCTILGHPKICSNRRFCAVSTTVECEDNFDCPGTSNFTNVADLCPYGPEWGITQNQNNKQIACTADSDCRQCTTASVNGSYRGRACSADTDCVTSYDGVNITYGTCGAPGSGSCILGTQQSHWTGFGKSNAGKSFDLTADFILGERTIEDAPGFVDATSLIAPSDVFYDAVADALYIKEAVRVTRRSGPAFSVNQAADLEFCQPDFAHEEDETSPGDISLGMGVPTRRSCGWSYWGGVSVVNDGSSAAGVYVQERMRLKVFPVAGPSGAAATKAFGVTAIDGVVRSAISIPELSGQPATMKRCVGGADIGDPCTVDGDCAASTCKTTLCTPASDYHRVMCWRDVGGAATGAAPDFTLCQPDTAQASQSANYEGSVTAKGCSSPHAVAFNPLTGDILVADSGNHRGLIFPGGAANGGGTAAFAAVCQPNLTTGTINNGGVATGCNFPEGIATNGVNFAVSDTFNNVIKTWTSVPATGVAPAHYLGQPNSTSNTGALSSGTLCDRLNLPQGIAFDSSQRLWAADGGNGRVYRFNTVDVTNSGDTAANAQLQGQNQCNYSTAVVNQSHMTLSVGGLAETSGGKMLVADSGGHRVVVETSVAGARSGEPNFEAVLGQSGYSGNLPNRGGAASASTLNTPIGVAWAPAFLAPARAYVCDFGNNRVLGYNGTSWTNGQAADIVFGQGASGTSFTTTAAGTSATGMDGPRGCAVDTFGNLYVADSNNGRVLVFCMGGTGAITAAAGGTICTNLNSGDVTPDMVIGKTSFTSVGCDCSPLSGGFCTATTASTLCHPMAVKVDSITNIFDIAVYVADDSNNVSYGAQGSQSGRVMAYRPGSWPVTGVAGSVALGPRPLAGSELTSYEKWGVGTCESTAGVSQNLECFYSEPSGFGITGALGSGGTAPLPLKTCVGSSNPAAACTIDANCPGGTCGCPSAGYCLYRRNIGTLYGLALDTTNQILYVARQGGVMQFIGPFLNNGPSRQVGLKGTAHSWENGLGFGSFVENSFGGNPLYAIGDIDSGLDYYLAAGPLYGGGMMVFDDPAPQPPTPTITQTFTVTLTRTKTNTPTVTNTPTSTPTVTQTPTGVLPPTPTITPTPSPSPSPSPTPSPSSTPSPTRTVTGVAPTNTPIPATLTPTGTPVISHWQTLNAEGFVIPPTSACTKTQLDFSGYSKWVVICPADAASVFYVKFHIVPSMTRKIRMQPFVTSRAEATDYCWSVSNVVNIPNDVNLNDGIPAESLVFSSNVNFSTPAAAPNFSSETTPPLAISLYNAKTGGFCADDSVCDNSSAYLQINRIIFGTCEATQPANWDQIVLSWPDVTD